MKTMNKMTESKEIKLTMSQLDIGVIGWDKIRLKNGMLAKLL